MATSGAMSTTNQYVKYSISITQNSQNITNNTSNVTVSVRFWRTNTGYTTYGTGTVYCKIDGTTYSAGITPSQGITNSGITLFTKTLDIKHNDDGKKVLTCSAWFSINSPCSSNEQSYSQTLTTIPRASSISSISGNMIGSSVTVNISRHSDSFTHNVYYTFGDSIDILVGSGVGTSCTFTPSMSDCSYLPNSTSGTASIKVITYNGSTAIGTASKTFTLYVPDTVKPTCTMTVTDEMGYFNTYGGFIQGLSKLHVEAVGHSAYGSPIHSYAILANNIDYRTSSVTTDPITDSETTYVYCTVMDTRGRSGYIDGRYIVLAYSKPKVANVSVHRCNSDGVEDLQGEYAKISYDCSISSLDGRNTLTSVIRYKKSKDSTYTSITDIETTYTASFTDRSIIIPAETASSYDIEIYVTDNFDTIPKGTSVSSGFAFHHYKGPNVRGKNLIQVTEGTETTTSLVVYTDVEPGESYTLTVSQTLTVASTSGMMQFQHWYKFLDASNNVLQESTIAVCAFSEVNATVIKSETITAPANATQIMLDLGCYYNDSQMSTGITNWAQFEKGTEFTGYEAYIPTLLASMGLGKLAELEGGLDVGFITRFANGIKQPILTHGSDLNDIIVSNVYAGDEISSSNYSNCPLSSGSFILEVITNENGIVKQRFTSCNTNNNIVYERWKNGTWTGWHQCSFWEDTLYYDSTGSNSTITLYDTVTNFKYIEVIYRTNDWVYGSTKVHDPNGKQIQLYGTYPYNGGYLHMKNTMVTINESTISFTSYSELTFLNNTVSSLANTSNIYITKVIGYR